VTEQDLAALGVHRIAIPIPFAAAGGPVNACAIEAADGSLVLFDAGLGSPEAEEALRAGLARLGRRLEEVSRVVVSHGHVDHFGAARWVQEAGGARAGAAADAVTVQVHAADAAKISEAGPRFRELQPAFDAHFARLGVPAEVRQVMARAGEMSYGLSRRVPRVAPLAEGDEVRGRHVRFRALHLPGHTPGLVALHEPDLRLLLPADHLLERISPNPLIELGPDGRDGFFRPLLAYLRSLERTRALDLDLVVPGHGPPFANHRAVIDGLGAFYGRRQARLVELLGEGPRTGWELCQALFPRAHPAEAFLTVSETVANLEVLEDRGEVERVEAGGVWRYRAAG
jgi:glyoxylase-like metal-dependent hydrolase (beta-lactamase superfamily II)